MIKWQIIYYNIIEIKKLTKIEENFSENYPFGWRKGVKLRLKVHSLT